MPLGTSLNRSMPQQTGDYAPAGVAVIRRNFTFADQGDGEIVIGVLPANACILAGGVWVKTLFDGTTPVIDVGVAGTPEMFASDLVLTAVAFVPLDAQTLAAAVPSASAARNIVAQIGGTAATAGSVDVIIQITS